MMPNAVNVHQKAAPQQQGVNVIAVCLIVEASGPWRLLHQSVEFHCLSALYLCVQSDLTHVRVHVSRHGKGTKTKIRAFVLQLFSNPHGILKQEQVRFNSCENIIVKMSKISSFDGDRT